MGSGSISERHEAQESLLQRQNIIAFHFQPVSVLLTESLLRARGVLTEWSQKKGNKS